MSTHHNIVVHLLALPGVGKLTIAKVLQKHLDAVLIDSHLINNPIFTVIAKNNVVPATSAVFALAHKVRKTVLETIETCTTDNANYIFTNMSVAGDEPMFQDMRDAFDRRGLTYVPIYMTCTEMELIKRRTSPGRKEQLKSFTAESASHDFHNKKLLVIPHENSLSMDVTNLSPDQAAQHILQHLDKIAS